MKGKIIRQEKGITLIALVITIIVLLILAGVAISMLSGENGILKQAENAKIETEEKSTIEQIKLGVLDAITEGLGDIKNTASLKNGLEGQGLSDVGEPTEINGGYLVAIGNEEYRISNNGEINKVMLLSENQGKVLSENQNVAVKDEYDNIIMIPAGFAITTDANNATKGLVITDKVNASTGASEGNEFVWIPVGKVYTTKLEERTDENTKTITLARYVFDPSDGSVMEDRTQTDPNGKLYTGTISNTANYYTDPDAVKFKTSVEDNGGYYIGRYEAGDAIATANGEARSDETDGKLVCKPNQQVYTWVSRTNALKESQSMYENSNFTSDLLNSFAWDTAILFIQTMENNTYSITCGKSTDTSGPKLTGTNTLSDTNSIDVQCNIYDMAGNLFEFCTENYSDSKNYCVERGGCFDGHDLSVYRGYDNDEAWEYPTFRPIIYM